MEQKIIKNKGAKYSEMLYDIIQEFDEDLPAELSFENTLEIGIEAWNLANKKDFLEKNNLYEKELKSYEYSDIIDSMVSYKLERFLKYDNVIVDYSTDNDTLTLKIQTAENHFNNVFQKIIMANVNQKSK